MNKVFVDDLTSQDSADRWMIEPEKMYLYQIRDLCVFGTLEDIVMES